MENQITLLVTISRIETIYYLQTDEKTALEWVYMGQTDLRRECNGKGYREWTDGRTML
jgi:hypothetical protein